MSGGWPDYDDLREWFEALPHGTVSPLLEGDWASLFHELDRLRSGEAIVERAQALTRKVAHDYPRYAGRWASTAQGWADGWNACLKALFPEQLDLWPEPPEAA